MKKYLSLGDLLIDFRTLNHISQSELAAILDVDIRSVIRWEKDETLIKPDKEKELVEKTFIPYQLIRNLNAAVPIPTYYDFPTRKYSLAELSNKLPDPDWFRKNTDVVSDRIRPIKTQADIDDILRYTEFQYHTAKPVKANLIFEAAKILPELNLVLLDTSGYYSGHCVFFPIRMETYQKLKNREMVEGELTPADLVNYKTIEMPVFYNYDVTADCNTNVYYILSAAFSFFRGFKRDYIYAGLSTRNDNAEFNDQLGVDLIWEDTKEQQALKMGFPPRFYEGNFKKFLGV